jgi:sulfoxide reductase catalytic subunit YedY
MPKQSFPKIPSSEITPEQVYLTRRDFIRMAGVAAGSIALTACGVQASTPSSSTSTSGSDSGGKKDERGDPANSFADITNYNNYYEFSSDKQRVATMVGDFKTTPWDVQVYGLVGKPKTYSLDELIKTFQPEERIYRLRCVEAWSMVIPWVGFPLSKLLKEVEPASAAKYVRFETLLDPDRMPGQRDPSYPWPYQEGLRMDEAMNDLAIMATGMYGGPLPAQDGGGIRLVTPWKYGFKSIKAVVRIELVADQPTSMWSTIVPNEYGFYANVNPAVNHPRWSQATERRIGEFKRRDTLMFNGYAEQVASLYTGMDLRQNY